MDAVGGVEQRIARLDLEARIADRHGQRAGMDRAGESLGGSGSAVDVASVYEAVEDSGAAPEETKTGAGAGGLFG